MPKSKTYGGTGADKYPNTVTGRGSIWCSPYYQEKERKGLTDRKREKERKEEGEERKRERKGRGKHMYILVPIQEPVLGRSGLSFICFVFNQLYLKCYAEARSL